MLNVRIGDKGSSLESSIAKLPGSTPGVVVYTRPLRILEQRVAFATNKTYGSDMNQNAAFSGTPEEIHDGLDNVYWTASEISGNWDFASTEQPNSGAQSIDGTGANNNHTAQFEASGNQDLSGFVALTGFIYIDNWSTGGSLKDIELEFRLNGSLVGNLVNMSGYVNTTEFDSWQKFVIPLADFGNEAETINQLWIRNRDQGGGAAPNFYLDDIQLEEVGIPLEYNVIANSNFGFIDTICITMADNTPSTVTNGTMPGLSYDSFLGATLANGIIIQQLRNDTVTFSTTITSLEDLLQIPNMELITSMSDGTNTFLKLELKYTELVPFNRADKDTFRVIISDDLSGLTRLRYSLRIAEVIE